MQVYPSDFNLESFMMETEYLKLCDELTNIASNEKNITGNSVLEILKKYSSKISVYDMMDISAAIIEENKYVQENYKEESQKSYVKAFICRINEISADKNNYPENIDKQDLVDAIKTLKSNRESQKEKPKSKISLVGCMTSIYTTFILEEPIHEVGTVFPGSLKIEEKNGKFYCPVKDANIDSPNAVCNICLAEQLEF